MTLPTLHMYLTGAAAGHMLLDVENPTASYHGGGSRAGFMGLVRGMGRLGKYEVTAFAPFKQRTTTLEGVRYVRLDNMRGEQPPDVGFSYYDGSPLHGNRARLRIHSAHTCLLLEPGFPWPHVYTAPSQWTVDHIRAHYVPHAPIHVLPNAVEGLEGVEWKPEPGRVLYHTSPDRGLHLLFEAWPEIKARVPHATLHVGGDPTDTIRSGSYYGMDGIYEFYRANLMRRNQKLAEEAGGVTLYGRVSREELLKELSEAACFAYPAELSMPSETSSISVLECCAIGVPVVLSPADALESVYRDSGVILTRAPADRYLHEFTDAVVDVLTNPERAAECSRREREFAKHFSFDKTAAVLDSLIESHLLKAVG